MELKIDENSAEKVIPANNSVRLVDKTVEAMDLTSVFGYWTPPATPMRTMLKAVLYSTTEHLLQSADPADHGRNDAQTWGEDERSLHQVVYLRRGSQLQLCSND